MKFMKLTWLLAVFLCVFYVGISVAEEKKIPDNMSVEPDNTPIAIGDGFVLTQNEVNEFRTFIEKGGFYRTTEKEYRKAALQVRLFTEEAKLIGLGQTADKKETGDTIESRMTLANLYNEKMLKEYVVNDIAIESYYLSNPDKFKESEQIKPLNDELKKSIRDIIVGANKKKVQNMAAEKLTQKYHVRLCDTDKGGCK